MFGKENLEDFIMQGAKYRQTHKASVMGVLGGKAPAVSSKGSRFYNKDRWTGRAVVEAMVTWARTNPNKTPNTTDIAAWVTQANRSEVDTPEIVIASTPDKLPVRTAMALTGGAYHEAFHTKYSCRRTITTQEIADIVIPRWSLVTDWSKFHKMLQEYINIIEDIRIERLGRKEFEGSFVKLADLNDFILKQENVFAEPQSPALSIVSRTFRDLGLDYETTIQTIAFAEYQKRNPDAYNMVKNGPLTPMLNEAINLNSKDDLGCVRVAMDVIAIIAQLGGRGEDPNGQGQGQGQTKCPKCGASGSKLRIKPNPKDPTKGTIRCTKCGWNSEIELKTSENDSPSDGQGDSDGPVFEGEQKEQKQGQGKGSDKQKDQKDSQQGQGSTSDKSDQNEKQDGKDSGKDASNDEQNAGSDGSADKENGSDKNDSTKTVGSDAGNSDAGEQGEGDTDKADSSDTNKNGSSGDGENSDSDKHNESQDEGSSDTPDNASEKPSADGHNYEAGETKGNTDWDDVADEICNDVESGKDSNIVDNNSALEAAFQEIADKQEGNLKSDEAVWKPYNSGLDEIHIVGNSGMSKERDRKVADKIIKSVKKEVTYLRSRLRTVIRSMEMVHPVHGVPKGHGLSSKFLVDSKISLMQKQNPSRAYWRRGLAIDTSMAVVVVLDESGSMGTWRKDASRILVALTEPFDALNFATMAIGFRNGQFNYDIDYADYKAGNYHRNSGITYDIFKTWTERFSAIKHRFANTRATGGTPMADGIQLALNAINKRDEAHRFIFVVTDGSPDGGHVPIIRHQIKQAKEAGIHIIGVGMGGSAREVKTLYPDYVHSDNIAEIPKLLLDKLNELADFGEHRSKRVKNLQKIGKKGF